MSFSDSLIEPGIDSGIYSLKQLHTLWLPASVITDEVIAKMMLQLFFFTFYLRSNEILKNNFPR
jgi:hypothetical protein